MLVSSMVILNTIITSSGTLGTLMEGGHPVVEFTAEVPVFGWSFPFVLTIERLWFALCQVMRILAIAMDLRCFGLRPRTRVQELIYQRRDYFLIGFGIFLISATLLSRLAFGIGEFWVPSWILP
jgi:energy-coupling factor transporter transmembrane protein EcfT